MPLDFASSIKLRICVFIYRLSTNTGIMAVDIGMPQLSMHSIREMMGTADLTSAVKFFSTFFRDFRTVRSSLET